MCPKQNKSQANRKYAIVYIYITLCLILLIYSVVIIAVSVNLLLVSLDKFEPLFRNSEPHPPLSLVQTASFIIGFNFVNSCLLLWGFSLIPKTSNLDSNKKKTKQYFVFVLLCLSFSLGYMAIFVVCIIHRMYIMENAGSIIVYAMKHYSVDSSMKTTLDKLQIYYSCCGDAGYSDWILLSQRSRNSFKKKIIIPPFSCCVNRDIEVCSKNAFSKSLTKIMNENMIWNIDGCSEVIRNAFGNWQLFLIGITSLMAFFIQVVTNIIGLMIYCNAESQPPTMDCNLEMEILSSEEDDRNNFVHRSINERRYEWKNNCYDDSNVLGYCSILNSPPE